MGLDAKDFEHLDDEYKVKGVNRRAKTDRNERMIENSRGLKTLIQPILAKKSKETRKEN